MLTTTIFTNLKSNVHSTSKLDLIAHPRTTYTTILLIKLNMCKPLTKFRLTNEMSEN